MAIPGGGVLLVDPGEKCPGKGCLLLVNPVCVGQLSSFSASRLKPVKSPLDLYHYGVNKIIDRTNTCPSGHLHLARETTCKLLLHTRRCHIWKASSPAVPSIWDPSAIPPSHQLWYRFSFLLLWKPFELSKQVLFNIIPSYQSQEKKRWPLQRM